MVKVFMMHGFEGSPNGGWRPYLMHELEKKDIYACSLPMPAPSTPKLSEWLEEMKRHVDNNQGDDVYFVGHSLGGTAILRYIEKYKSPNLKGAVIVSAPCHQNDNKEIASFLQEEFNWQKMREGGLKIAVVHGDNDPFVPLADAEETARELNGELIIIPNGQHLNGLAGYTELPESLSALLSLID